MAQRTDSELLAAAEVIKNETQSGANTATRVGTELSEIVENKINNDKISTTIGSTNTKVPSELAVSTALGLKANLASPTFTGTVGGITQTMVGLANVDDTSDVNKPISTAQLAALNLKEDLSNKSVSVNTDGASDTKYPSVKAVKTYADGLAVGLLRDRGNYDASVNLFPSTGGSGAAGAVAQGDLWYISVGGSLGGTPVFVGYSVRALVNTPGQTTGNWSILNVGLGFTPENTLNKSTDGTLSSNSDILFPTEKAVKTYVGSSIAALGISPFDYEYLYVTGTNSSTANLITKKYTDVAKDTGNYVKLPANPTIGDVYTICNAGDSTGTYALDLYVVASSGDIIYNAGVPNLGSSSYQAGLPSKSIHVFRCFTASKWVVSREISFLPQEPLVSGTNIKTVGGTSILGSGDIPLSGGSYKVYTALANWGSGVLNVTVLENTLGATITWADVFTTMTGTASSAVFTVNKTVAIAGSYFQSTNTYNNVCNRINDTTLRLFSINTKDGSGGAAFGQNFMLEIRVYN